MCKLDVETWSKTVFSKVLEHGPEWVKKENETTLCHDRVHRHTKSKQANKQKCSKQCILLLGKTSSVWSILFN